MNIGFALTTLRQKRKLTQGQLAAKAGISQTFLSQIEKSRKRPTLTTIESLARALGIPASLLFVLALEEEDIELSRRSLYQTISPTIRQLVNLLFDDDKAIDSPVF